MPFAHTLLRSASIFVVLSSSPALGQCTSKQISKFFSADSSYSYNFASNLDVSGSRMVTCSNGSNGTYLHVYERQQAGDWAEVAVIQPPSSDPTAAIGGSVICVKGAGGGQVHVYELVGGSWVGPNTILAPPSALSGIFGKSLAIGSGRIFIGCPSGNSGSVFVYEKQGAVWVNVATASPSVPKAGSFGSALAIDNDRLAVGAFTETTSAFGAGAAYVFEQENGAWPQKARLALPGPSQYGLGFSVAVSGERVVVGMGGYGYAGAYVFEKAGPFWTYAGDLSTTDPAASATFGSVVAIDGSQVYVSDYGYTMGTSTTGCVFAFERVTETWVSKSTLTPADYSNSEFGRALKPTSGGLIVGAPHAVGKTSQSGAVYEMSTMPNPASKFGTPCAGTGGFLPILGLPQSYDGCVFPGTSLTFTVSGGLGGSSALVLIGLAPTNTVLPNGCSVLVSPVVTVVPVPLFGAGPGNGSVSFGATVPIVVGAGSVYLQAISIEPGVSGGFAASNGLRVTVN